MHEYTVDVKELSEAKKRNDWLKILRMYGYEQMDKPVIFANLTADDSNELFFAASHWADALTKQATTIMMQRNASTNDKKYTAERAINAILWINTWLEAAYKHYKTISIANSLAYNYYQLRLSTSVLGKLSKRCNVSSDLKQKCANIVVSCFKNGYDLLKQIIQQNPEDFKNTYRLGNLIEKEKKEFGYRKLRESKKDYEVWFSEIIECFTRIEKAYEKFNPPKIDRKKYIKAKFGLARVINDEFLCAFDTKYCIKQVRKHAKINVVSTNDIITCYWTELKFSLKDIKRADDAIKVVKKELNYAENPTDDDIDRIAKEPEPIEQAHFVYYRQAKIYYTMMLIYGSSIWPIYKMRQTPEGSSRTNKKYDHFYELAVQNAKYALDLRIARKSLGMKDAGGAAFHEPELLAQLYSLSRDDKIAAVKLEELKKRFPHDKNIEYYYIITNYFLRNDDPNIREETIERLKQYAKDLKMESLKKRVENTIMAIRNGKI